MPTHSVDFLDVFFSDVEADDFFEDVSGTSFEVAGALFDLLA